MGAAQAVALVAAAAGGNMEPEHATTAIDFTDIRDGNGTIIGTCATIKCLCGESVTSQEFAGPTRVYLARRDAESAWARHREFRLMHVGLFEDTT